MKASYTYVLPQAQHAITIGVMATSDKEGREKAADMIGSETAEARTKLMSELKLATVVDIELLRQRIEQTTDRRPPWMGEE